MMNTVVIFKNDWRPNKGPAYNTGEGAAFPIAQAVWLVAQGICDFANPADAAANEFAVAAIVTRQRAAK